MRLLMAVLLLVSFSASAAVMWSDLEPGEFYHLDKSFQLKLTDRSGSSLAVMQGEKVQFRGIIPISVPGFPMMLYQFNYLNCPGMQAVSEIDIVEAVQPSGAVVQVGAQLDEYCILQFYIETRDWLTNSLFQ